MHDMRQYCKMILNEWIFLSSKCLIESKAFTDLDPIVGMQKAAEKSASLLWGTVSGLLKTGTFRTAQTTVTPSSVATKSKVNINDFRQLAFFGEL